MSNGPTKQTTLSTGFQESSQLLLGELQRVLQAVSAEEVQAAAQELLQAERIFFAGAGRSKLALEMAAMRFMHLGLRVHVAGEVTAPAIAAGDLLLVASASGTTTSAVHAAEVAKKAGARLLVVTTAPQSSLAKLADAMITVPAAAKTDTGERASAQYAGSLFEQTILLLLDGMFHSMWQSGPQSAETLLQRHANLE